MLSPSPPIREFFELALLTAGQWFLSLVAVATGLVIAGLGWRIPQIQALDAPVAETPRPESGPEPTHTPRTQETEVLPRP